MMKRYVFLMPLFHMLLCGPAIAEEQVVDSLESQVMVGGVVPLYRNWVSLAVRVLQRWDHLNDDSPEYRASIGPRFDIEAGEHGEYIFVSPKLGFSTSMDGRVWGIGSMWIGMGFVQRMIEGSLRLEFLFAEEGESLEEIDTFKSDVLFRSWINLSMVNLGVQGEMRFGEHYLPEKLLLSAGPHVGVTLLVFHVELQYSYGTIGHIIGLVSEVDFDLLRWDNGND